MFRVHSKLIRGTQSRLRSFPSLLSLSSSSRSLSSLSFGKYQDVYHNSINNRDNFWLEVAEEVEWIQKPTVGYNEGTERWFEDGQLNTCYNTLDRHVLNGKGDDVAIYYDSPVTDSKSSLTYRELLEQVEELAAAMRTESGVKKGDRVLIYMPMIPEAAVAMLACARIGAVHSVVFGGFAGGELAKRIDDAKPKLIISASCGIEVKKVIDYKVMLDEAMEIAQFKVPQSVVFQRPQSTATLQAGRDRDWEEFVASGAAASKDDPTLSACEAIQSTDPLYIIYTSGTTGAPKGVVRDQGGAVSVSWAMRNVMDVNSRRERDGNTDETNVASAKAKPDVMWAASDIGWVVGHTFIVYGPLLVGGSTVMYEGKPVGTPDAGAYWRVIEEYGVNSFFTAPTAARAIQREDPDGKLASSYDLSSLAAVHMAGERLDPSSEKWMGDVTGRPINDNWWQTETGWPVCSNFLGMDPHETKVGSATLPVPGFDVKVVNKHGKELEAGEYGNIVLKKPLPPGCLYTLWENHDRFLSSYFSKYMGVAAADGISEYYDTSDAGYKDEDGYVFIMSRTDDVLNVAGHRLSSSAMEEVLMEHRDVADCAVIGIPDALKGQVPLGVIVMTADRTESDEEVIKQLSQKVRDRIGAVSSLKQILVAKRLPKTRSGKILRNVMRNIANCEDPNPPATIEDEKVVAEIDELFVDVKKQQ